MLNRFIGALLTVALVFVLCAGTVDAQERVRLGRFSHYYGSVKVKEIGATGTSVQLQDTWINKGVYKGDEIVTGEDSKVEIMIESTKVEMLEWTQATMDSTDEGLYVIHMARGNIIAHIKTDVFQLKVYNQIIYGKGAVVDVKIKSNKDIVVKAISGVPYIDNEYEVTLAVPEEQVVTIKYDRLRREYTFRPSLENRIDLPVKPKDAKDWVRIAHRREFVVSEDGKGKLRDVVIQGPVGPKEEKPKPKREFSVNALMRYDWFESSQEICWYRGEMETFKTARASLGVDTKYKFAEIFLGIDAVHDNPLEDLWLRLFIPRNEEIINFKIGQMHLPFGRQVQTYPEDLLMLEYSQAVKYAFASIHGDPAPPSADIDYLFDVGAQVYGRFELFADIEFQYSVGVFNGEKRATNDTNDHKAGVGRAGLKFNDTLTIGGSCYEGKTWIIARDRYSSVARRRTGIDFTIDAGEFILQAEYIWAEDNPRTNTSLPATYGSGKRNNLTEGLYVQAGLGLGAVKESWKKWMLVAKLDVLLPPRGMVNPGSEDQHVRSNLFAGGLVWRISEEVKFTAVFEVLSQGNERYPAPMKEGDANQRAIFQFNISF